MATKDVAIDHSRRELFVVDDASNEIDVYKLDDAGTVATKVRNITGAATELNAPSGITVSPERDEIYVVNGSDGKLIVFDVRASGNAKPLRVITLL